MARKRYIAAKLRQHEQTTAPEYFLEGALTKAGLLSSVQTSHHL